jgi:hypothetical protein
MGPMRTEARAVLTDALRDAHHWLDELSTSPNLNIESLAAREGKTERWIRRTISLAFLCPALVKAAIDGRLPRGFGVKRLMDLPMAWPDQWSALGLIPAPIDPDSGGIPESAPAIMDAIFSGIRDKALICARPTRVLRAIERRLTSIIRSAAPA